ncbi:hypothetical protein LPTSP4_08500 [Leptospira ryugenii]|uniref:Uncharacterized protein n=1 Tax=Leptospira ryugenii TaxID=1917863 RepID=A0A2P2DXI5_9LEPT|nr:hypothetical protein [Leptospira ryugenii]GBF49339.1 hypothetical protein LPTSP4_08500 [Leptospira ryugenii]
MELILKADVKTINEVLNDPKFRDDIQINLQSWKEDYSVSDEDYASTKTWIQDTIDKFLQTVNDVEVEAELTSLVFFKYIELKSLWKQMNVQIQYQNFLMGQADPNLVGRASLTTFILIAIEPLLHDGELAEIQEFLTKPIREMLRVESSVDIFAADNQSNDLALMEAQLDSLYADKEYIFKEIGLSHADEILEAIENLKEQVEDLKQEFSDSIIISDKITFLGKRKITIQKQG